MQPHPTDDRDIVLDERGLAYLRGSRLRVRQLGIEHTRDGLSPHELRWRYPDLTIEQIVTALSFFRNHARRMAYEAILEQTGR